ncbi:aminotransferase class I/II-fold pyridoxal phosphate-dependent enzyme [Clostridium sp. DJ247]|uniref:aminotransferase class I/II-fold pyridoxal phosphate-dependent enzyme n=1 Tax=Clostridium sp. DJ247 TaxID=2726188 RepID=UPI001626DEBB|nr:aminotransferase class I/II-fold pyridoxal phosphate-dependent enzyme [Clostridium sp. DJ247]MBC2580720.1 aminotransferase class I/II-fold pyridoxal phosphate-dependent enzyme [Clostridium sp. DJ247]
MAVLKYREALNDISSYTPAKSLEEIERELGLNKIIRLSANENTMGCSPSVQVAIEEASKNLYLYPDGFCRQLRSKLAEINNVEQEQLIFGNGSFELLSLIAQAFINADEESIIPEPTFGWYKVVTLSMNGVIVSVPLENHAINLEHIKSKITDKTKVIWLCNPNNLTGTIFGEKQLEKFLEETPSDIIVVLDEAYDEFTTSDDYPDSIKLIDRYPNVIILRTFSKVYGLASLRIGYGIANSELISYLNKIRLPINVNAIAQIAALASLYDESGKVTDFNILNTSPKLVLADTRIIANAPVRYLNAGIGDTIVKWYEAAPNSIEGNNDISLRIGLQTAKLALDILHNSSVSAAKEIEKNHVNKEVSEVIDAIIILADLVGSINGGNHRAAIAHAIHNSLTAIPETHESLHGEKVIFGLIVQFILEGKLQKEIEELIDFLNLLNLPVTLEQLGIKDSVPEKIANVANGVNIAAEELDKINFEVNSNLIEQAIIKADQLGKSRLKILLQS